jgi:hypothetical protein
MIRSWCHRNVIASQTIIENQVAFGFIKHGWEIRELNGGF